MAENGVFRTTSGAEGRSTTGAMLIVESFGSYAAAQEAVDSLAHRGFPVERLTVVARDLVLVEQGTSRRTMWRVAGEDACAGAFIGAVLGFLMALFDWVDPLVSAFAVAFWCVVFGAAVGAAIGVAGLWALGGRRDVSGVTGMEAGRFDLMADEEAAGEVRRLLKQPPADVS